jgi:hypothetical protein
MGLIVEIEAIGDQLLDIDLRWPFATPVARTAPATGTSASLTASVASVTAIGTPLTAFVGPWASASILIRRPILAPTLFRLLLFHFCHG